MNGELSTATSKKQPILIDKGGLVPPSATGTGPTAGQTKPASPATGTTSLANASTVKTKQVTLEDGTPLQSILLPGPQLIAEPVEEDKSEEKEIIPVNEEGKIPLNGGEHGMMTGNENWDAYEKETGSQNTDNQDNDEYEDDDDDYSEESVEVTTTPPADVVELDEASNENKQGEQADEYDYVYDDDEDDDTDVDPTDNEYDYSQEEGFDVSSEEGLVTDDPTMNAELEKMFADDDDEDSEDYEYNYDSSETPLIDIESNTDKIQNYKSSGTFIYNLHECS